MEKFFSNTNKRKDFLGQELIKYAKDNEVLIAVAFFTNEQFIRKLVENGCTVKLIVRLGFPTDPISLKNVMKLKNVYVRFFTNSSFHPKLYILGNDKAFLGSSNLTQAGLFSNQELNISIDSEDEAFYDLTEIFYDYWEEAHVLNEEILETYKKSIAILSKEYNKTINDINSAIGLISPPNDVDLTKRKKNKAKDYEASLNKRYQEYLVHFEHLKQTYLKVGRRKVSENQLPLRIEIHRFLNWIRKNKAYKDLYINAPIRTGKELEDHVEAKIIEYFNDSTTDFDYEIESYQILNENFSTPDKIKNLTDEDLLKTLKRITSFYEHIRRSENMSYQYEFINNNGIDKIKNTLIYLLFGTEEFKKRITNCINHPDYSLSRFGNSCIQETYGWLNNEDVPICNERAFKSMRWLGYSKFR